MTAQSQPSPRELFEASHSRFLAPFAVNDSDDARAFPEPPHSYRTCFQRDRDRIVHCSAFRRLDFKTQVFVPHEHDHFRTRLTHTLEVAQIGRSLARALRLNEDLVEAVALAHDLGHPPFGHAGETALNELMADHGHFEHNRQSLRVVDYLEHPYPRFRGLNLTHVVRECLAKHRTRYDTPTCQEFDASLQAPLEGQLADAADAIAYTSADLEDALAAGWVEPSQLEGLSLWRQAWQAAKAEFPDAKAAHQRIRAVKGVLAAMADDLVAFSSARIAQLGMDSPAAARQAGEAAVGLSPGIAAAVEQMQDFLMERVYTHPVNMRHVGAARKIIRELFEAYASDARLLPERYRRRIDGDGAHRVACDYIAGMTDRFCRGEHAKLCGAESSQDA